jgi:hypothetical protein
MHSRSLADDSRKAYSNQFRGRKRKVLVKRFWTVLLCTTVLSSAVYALWTHRATATRLPIATQEAATRRDGQHDFDFDIGTWKTHTSRLQHPLTGSKTWIEMEGTTVVRKIWNGRGNLAVLESDGPTGHLELLSLRLYDPQAKQWSLNFATSKVGTISVPMIGEFNNGRAEFYDQEPFNGRTIWVRFTMFPISPNSAQSEQSFSDDGGKSWETNWINKYTRSSDEPEKAH